MGVSYGWSRAYRCTSLCVYCNSRERRVRFLLRCVVSFLVYYVLLQPSVVVPFNAVYSFGSIQFTYLFWGGFFLFFFSHCCVFPESTKEPQQEKRARTPLPLRLYSSSARSGRSSSSLSSISIIHQQFVFFKFLKRGWVSCRNFVWLVGNPSIPWHRQLWFTISLGIRWTKSLNIIIITRIFVLFKCRVKCSHFLCFFRYSDSILTCSDDDETSNSMEFSKVRK
jgi:hypothetical protein